VKTITEPSKELPVVGEVDVLVAGGGPAGIAAATAAARTGARVMLVERYGYLGGLATGGLVLYMDGTFDRTGRRCIGGIYWEAMERLRAIGGLVAETPARLHVDSELLKVVADEICLEAGVNLRLHSWVVEALVKEGRVQGVILESKSGRQAVLAQVCVDATGDCDVAAQAGAAYELHTMRMGLNAKIGGVDVEAFRGWQEDSPEHARALHATVRALGGCPMGTNATPHEDLGVYWVNVLGLTNRGENPQAELPGGVFSGELNAVDVEDLTFAEVELRKRFMVGFEYYRKHVPGFGDARLLMFASELGVRDSRRIVGVHHLTRAQMEAGERFEDAIGITGQTFTQGNHLQVPYRTLLPVETDGLLVAGRCISVDDGLIGPVRVIPPCMMTGEAAGTAAALSVREGVAPRELDAGLLREALAGAGVILPQ
jgi:hypothetical protein